MEAEKTSFFFFCFPSGRQIRSPDMAMNCSVFRRSSLFPPEFVVKAGVDGPDFTAKLLEVWAEETAIRMSDKKS
nr:hypothetical protein BaRGS_002971 [Batillaria attramentaria]